MRFNVAKSLTALLIISAVIALPTAVKAQTDYLSISAPEVTVSGNQIGTELNYCFRVPGYGWVCV